METPLVRELPAERAARNTRARAISLLGPATVAAGLIWAILQPYRVTLLHPRGEGLWWLVFEPPLLVAAAGVVFALVVAKPLLADLEARDAAPR
jgi:ABC-type Co2+ transport system permease subunit